MGSKRKPVGYWTVDRIIEKLKDRIRNGEPVDGKGLKEGDSKLYGAVIRHIGNPKKALEIVTKEVLGEDYANGITRQRRPRNYWTKETVIEEILARDHAGLSLSSMRLRTEDSSLYNYGTKFYGAWWKALESAGLDWRNYCMNTPKGYWTPESVMGEIEGRYQQREWEMAVDVKDSNSGVYINALKHHGSVRGVFERLYSEVEQVEEAIRYAESVEGSVKVRKIAEREAAEKPLPSKRETNEYTKESIVSQSPSTKVEGMKVQIL